MDVVVVVVNILFPSSIFMLWPRCRGVAVAASYHIHW